MNIDQEVTALAQLSIVDLRARFAASCGFTTTSRNRKWLIRRIAWKLQAQSEGGLSQRALAKAAELASGAELRLTQPWIRKSPAPRPAQTPLVPQPESAPDSRLPQPGGMITRLYKGQKLEVRVLEKGFEYEGDVFRSLTAVAKQITGSHCNGYHFFRLAGGA
jgi:hypothetical protein